MPTPQPQRPCLRVVCLILLAQHFALVACGPLGSTLEEDTPLAGAGNLKDSALVVTVSRVVDGDTVEVTPAVDALTEVRLIGLPDDCMSTRSCSSRATPNWPRSRQTSSTSSTSKKPRGKRGGCIEGLWALSGGQLCQQTDSGNGIGGGCDAGSGSEEERPSLSGPSAARRGGDLDCSDFSTQEAAEEVFDQEHSNPTASTAATRMGWSARAFPETVGT
jgi:hypothetical protein